MTESREATNISRKQVVRNYRDLLVWQKAMSLVEEIYALTRQFPADERFGLVVQLRRAAVSIPSNLAEGQARKSHAEGSLAEVDTQLTLSQRLAFCQERETKQSSRMLRRYERCWQVCAENWTATPDEA